MKRLVNKVGRAARQIRSDEEGAVTIMLLFFTLIFIVIGGMAIDFNKAIAERTRLQVAADVGAHAALYSREDANADDAIAEGHQLANKLLVKDGHDGALERSDFTFGVWDFENLTFTADANSLTAIRVNTGMTESRLNPAKNLLLGIIGFDTFDIARRSVYTHYYPPCFTEGFVAEEPVDIQSNNAFSNGFCLHSNQYVALNSNNIFDPGTVVSMPDTNNLDIPKSGFEKNDGLREALRTGAYRMRLLNDLPDMIESLRLGEKKHMPDYITSGNVTNLDGKNKLTPADFVPGQLHRMSCSGAGKMTMDPGVYERIVFVSNCEIKFGQGVHLEDAVIATTRTGPRSFNSPADLYLGRDDNCATGGGSVLMTLGGVDVAASLNVFGGQILAIGDINFAANANGIQGASFVSYGRIDGTSNMNMGFCAGSGMENAYRKPYYRMVE
jgi:hypothetical protein